VGRLLLPNNGPCTLDWGIVGTWVQGTFVLAGVIVAYTQLQALNQNERVKTTLNVYYDLTRTIIPLPGGNPQTIFGALRDIGNTIIRPDAFVAALRRLDSRSLSPQDVLYLTTVRANVSIVHNYFDTVSAMSRRGLLDDDIMFFTMARIITSSYKILSHMISLDRSAELMDSPLFRDLAARADGYIANHKARFAHLREIDIDAIFKKGPGASDAEQDQNGP
jgi:hypothetical protein